MQYMGGEWHNEQKGAMLVRNEQFTDRYQSFLET